ncbi:MAG: two-component system sensor histidine kinase CreC [Akkermansiaceae bacterium]|jgi:two-component system sensor histidine kinase CreC
MRLTRVTLFFITLIIGLGFYRLTDYLLEDLEAQTLQATEESMVDSSQLLANFVENDQDPAKLFKGIAKREFKAPIFSVLKNKVGINAYLTDVNGIVIFDSGTPQSVGKDFSGWADVNKTLQGRYGARSSRSDESDPNSSVMFVGAPIRREGKIVGCLSVYKAQSDVLPFVHERRKTIIWAAILIGLGILALIGAVFIWLFRPVGKLTSYARAITRGERLSKPSVGLGREVNTLANALHDMRESLEGRHYAERYIQTLTHELKSPLAAIQGAAELINEDMPQNDRARFVGNIRNQTKRCEELIHQLLELSALEAQTHLENSHPFDLAGCCQKSLDEMSALAESTGITLHADLPEALPFHGNEPLLNSALNHLLQNALQFSPKGGKVTLSAETSGKTMHLTVSDEGAGIPDFAANRAFERFYSYRKEGGGKGNGLGLAFVKEVAELHQGTATITAYPEGGTRSSIQLPVLTSNPS